MLEFREVFENELSYVWNTLRRFGVPDRDREDVAHDVFMVVHRRLDEFDARRPIRPWLFGIAYRRAADYRRLSRHKQELTGDLSDRLDTSPLADEALAAEEARAFLAEALAAIDLDRGAAVILHDIEGVPASEIADALSIPVRTVYSRIRVGREELAQAIKRLQLRRGKP